MSDQLDVFADGGAYLLSVIHKIEALDAAIRAKSRRISRLHKLARRLGFERLRTIRFENPNFLSLPEDGDRRPYRLAFRDHQKWVRHRDGGRCVYCGSDEDLTTDHIEPLSAGGSNRLGNLATACRQCNSSKGPKALADWQGRKSL